MQLSAAQELFRRRRPPLTFASRRSRHCPGGGLDTVHVPVRKCRLPPPLRIVGGYDSECHNFVWMLEKPGYSKL